MLLKEFYDHYYENTGFTTIRSTARALVFDEQGRMGMMHIVGDDIFGARDHYETPGGGIEAGEDAETAIHREVLEEVGFACRIDSYLGSVINRYNLLEVITVHHFFVCTITKKEATAWTASEQEWFQGVVWKTPQEWVDILAKPRPMVNELVHQRERFILSYFLNQ